MVSMASAPAYAAWPFPDSTGLPSWDERVRALLPPSVDPTQLREDLASTPQQRIEKLQALVDAVEALRRGRK